MYAEANLSEHNRFTIIQQHSARSCRTLKIQVDSVDSILARVDTEQQIVNVKSVILPPMMRGLLAVLGAASSTYAADRGAADLRAADLSRFLGVRVRG